MVLYSILLMFSGKVQAGCMTRFQPQSFFVSRSTFERSTMRITAQSGHMGPVFTFHADENQVVYDFLNQRFTIDGTRLITRRESHPYTMPGGREVIGQIVFAPQKASFTILSLDGQGVGDPMAQKLVVHFFKRKRDVGIIYWIEEKGRVMGKKSVVRMRASGLASGSIEEGAPSKRIDLSTHRIVYTATCHARKATVTGYREIASID